MTLRPGEKSLTPTGNPNNYYNKSQTDELLNAKQDTLVSGTNIKTINFTSVLGSGNLALADQSLSNLDSTGQMVIDSQNGTISNCILEIPQNIKLEINSTDGLVLKSGSIITLSGSTYTTYTTTSDKSIKSVGVGKRVIFLTQSNYALTAFNINNITSGTTDSRAGEVYHVWFDTENKLIKAYTTSGDTVAYTCSYPLCVVETDSSGNVIGFAKDSNGNDMIFNGACFVGHHAVVYPNVKVLIPNGLNSNGSLKSTGVIRDSLYIRELTSGNFKLWCMSTGSIWSAGFKGEVNNINDVPLTNGIYYVKNQNVNIQVYNNTLSVYSGMMCADYTYDGTTVTDFAIRQPVRTATVEMLQKSLGDLETLLAAI